MTQVNLIRRALSRLKSGLDTAAAEEITIVNGNESLTGINGIPGRRGFREFLVEEAAGTEADFDWIVTAADLVFVDAGLQEPAKGWSIRLEMDDGRDAVWDVLPADGTRVFDPVDQLGILLRIHTKFRGFEEHE